MVPVSSWSLTLCLEEMTCWFRVKPTCSVNTGSLRGWQWSNWLQSTWFGWQPAGWSPATLPHSLHHVVGLHWQAVSDDPPWGCVGNIKSYWLWDSLWTSEAQPLVLCSAGQRCSDNCSDGSCEEWLNRVPQWSCLLFLCPPAHCKGTPRSSSCQIILFGQYGALLPISLRPGNSPSALLRHQLLR